MPSTSPYNLNLNSLKYFTFFTNAIISWPQSVFHPLLRTSVCLMDRQVHPILTNLGLTLTLPIAHFKFKKAFGGTKKSLTNTLNSNIVPCFVGNQAYFLC